MKSCPECGYPLAGNETSCPECGYPIPGNNYNQPKENLTQSIENYHKPDENHQHSYEERNFEARHKSYNPDNDYNETKGYSPFQATAWIFSTPSILKRYPRGEFELRYPFWGWLFGPWHISNNNSEDSEYINVVNNIFYLLNQIFKFFVYVFCWVFFKAWYIYLIAYIFQFVFMASIFEGSNDLIIILICGIIMACIFILLLILNISAILASLQRYASPIIRSFRRICKRHWISMYNAVKYNDLDLK